VVKKKETMMGSTEKNERMKDDNAFDNENNILVRLTKEEF